MLIQLISVDFLHILRTDSVCFTKGNISSVISPVCLSLLHSTCSPVHILHLITGMLCSREICGISLFFFLKKLIHSSLCYSFSHMAPVAAEHAIQITGINVRLANRMIILIICLLSPGDMFSQSFLNSLLNILIRFLLQRLCRKNNIEQPVLPDQTFFIG